CLTRYYHVWSHNEQRTWGYASRTEAFFRSGLFIGFLLELGIALLAPIPFKSTVGYGEKVIIAMFLFRLEMLLWLIRDYSVLYKNRFDFKKFSQFDHPAFDVPIPRARRQRVTPPQS